MLNVGFNNYVNPDVIIGIVDYTLRNSKRMVRTARADRIRSVADVSKGRKILSLLILEGDRYVLSALPVVQLANRWMRLKEPPAPKRGPYKKKDVSSTRLKEKEEPEEVTSD